MNKVLNVYKPISDTPLQVVERLKQRFKEYENETISYAGRLDPLAHGVLLLLVGDANKERRNYEKLSKVYEFKCIIGFGTDTYDVLGLPRVDHSIFERNITDEEIRNAFMKYQGTFVQELPPFSSYQIERIPLFKWARMGRLHEIQIPRREVTVEKMEVLEIRDMEVSTLLKTITDRISDVEGDFRQKECMRRWDDVTKEYQANRVKVIHARASVTSGTYIRSICSEIGKDLGSKAVALEIYRTQAGEFKVEDSMAV